MTWAHTTKNLGGRRQPVWHKVTAAPWSPFKSVALCGWALPNARLAFAETPAGYPICAQCAKFDGHKQAERLRKYGA